MNFKTTYILFGILALALGIFVATVWWGSTEVPNTTYVLQSMHDPAAPMKPDEVDKVEIKRERPTAETLVFQRDPESKRWRITQPRELRADRDAITSLVNQFYDAHREEHIDTPPSLADWGLDPPAEVITLWKGDRSVSLNVGNTRPGGGENTVVYVTAGDHPKDGMAVKKNQLDSVFKKLVDFRSRELLAASAFDIQAVTLSEGKKGPLELKKSGERWRYVKPDYGYAESEGVMGGAATEPGKPPRNVNALLGDIANLKVEFKDEKDNDFVADDVSDLHKYNLEPSQDRILRVEVRRTEEGGRSATAALLIGVGKKAGDKYYARLDGEKSVVKVSAKDVDPMLALLDDMGALRDRNLVDLGAFNKPDAIDVRVGGMQLRFRKPANALTWRLYYTGGGDTGHAVDPGAISTLTSALTKKDQVVEFPTGAAAEYGLDKPDVVVKVWTGGLAAPEKKKDAKDQKESEPKLKEPNKPTVELRFGKVDKDKGQVYVERKPAGEAKGTLVKVSDKLLDEVKQGPLAYLDKSLPQFNPNEFDATKDVTKIVLERSGGTWEITRTKPAKDKSSRASEWKIDKPADLAGRAADPEAVQNILNAVNRMRAIKLIALKASDLKEYGLDKPQVKAIVTVTKAGKAKTYEYDFGKDAKEGVFAKQGWESTIFTTSKGIVTTLNADLRDPTVFTFDVAKVEKVTITGWQQIVGSPLTLALERKNASQWVVKSPAGFKLDAAKLRQLLEELSRLRAERLLGKRASKPEDGLEVAQGALVIDLTVAKEGLLKLTVGKLDGDKGYFATSNKLPGEMFDVRKDIFEAPKTKPAYFSP